MKKKYFVLLLFFFGIITTYSQNITVKGKVSDNNGLPLPGANVSIKGTKLAVSTDLDGNYQIAASKGGILVFSYIGFSNQEIKVSGDVLNITLKEGEGNKLEEVVVTAFGVTKKAKSLGYTTQQVFAKDLKTAGQTNVMEALQGMVSGVSITKSSGAAGGGIDILIRGVTSLDAGNNNQPLIVIDGNQLNNDTFSGNVLPTVGSNSPSSSEQASFSSRLGDINQNDIESINVLKGSGATALYGIKGANGVIIITTKKGKAGKMKVNFSTSTSFSEVNKYPELQSRWREGTSVTNNSTGVVTFTPRVLSTNAPTASGISFYPGFSSGFQSYGPLYSATDDASIHFRDFYRDFFKTGTNFQNSLSLSGAKDNYNYFFSASSSKDDGIVPNTGYDRKTFKISGNYNLTDNFIIGTSITYSNSGGKRPGGGDKSIMSALSYWSPSIDVNDYLRADGKQKNFTAGTADNPRYLTESSNLSDDVDRWIASVNASWKINSWMKVVYNGSLDNYTDNRNRFAPPDLDVATQVKGFITNEAIKFKGLNSNLLLTFDKKINANFNNSLTLGSSTDQTIYNYAMIRGEGIGVTGFNNIANTTNLYQNNYIQKRNVVGIFGEYKIDFKDRLFLTLTGRRDLASSLPAKNRSFFYPSASLAFLFNDLIDKNNSILSYGKLRSSWSQVGKVPPAETVGRYWTSNPNFPYNGNGGFTYSTTAGDLDLVAEIKTALEVGIDLGFFKDRLRLEYSFYKNNSKNQLLPLQVSPTSGINRYWTNAGELQNIGHEVLLKGEIIRSTNFSWKSTISWSANKGEVLSLPRQLPNITFADSGAAGIVSQVQVGDAPGTFYGYTWKYVDGQRLIVNGMPVVDNANVTLRKKVGNAFPDWVGSINNAVSYKGLGLSFLLEYKKGGDAYDAGQRNGIRNGNLAITDNRNVTTVLEGVMSNGSGGYIPNTVPITLGGDNYYRNGNYNTAAENLIQDASWVKLRNVSLSYNLPSDVLSKLKISSCSFSVSGSNFLLWTPFRGFDPEGNQYSAGSNTYGFTGLNVPLTKSYSLGLNLGF